jgi:hypothetical protein
LATASTALFDAPSWRTILLDRHEERVSEPVTRRKLWELDSSLHCSVIGTCLSSTELRLLIGKFHRPSQGAPSDHALHTIAVSAAGQRNLLAKQIQKALDRRHAAAIRYFSGAKSPEELRRRWAEAKQAGEIPGAYWAVLSHPRTSEALIREVFGDVHMLSHLVGAANRADIRRLHELEIEKAALEEKLARQQSHLRDGIGARDARIRELTAASSARIEAQRRAAADAPDSASEIATLHALVADLRRLLDRETERRTRIEKRADELAATNSKAEQTRARLAAEAAALRAELEAAENRLTELHGEPAASTRLDLAGMTVLYVGGKPQHVARLRLLVESASGQFICHDGGIEERADLLPGLVSRADAAFFPVDCISHRAALLLKRLCQQAGKPYVPLRNASAAAMLRALSAARAE